MASANKDILKLKAQVMALLNPRKTDAIVMSTVFAEQHSRIFNDAGSRDSRGKALGEYTDGYKRQRRKVGESGDVVKLVFTGDMRDDYLPELDSDGFVFGFDDKTGTNPPPSKKAEYVEKTYNTDIFSLSNAELNLAEKTWQNVLNKIFR